MLKNTLVLIFSLIISACCGGANADGVAALTLITDNKNWGKVNPVDAKAVALSSAKEVLKHFPDITLKPIILKNKIKNNPVVLYQKGNKGEYIIGVNIDGLRWSQLAYQFAHEITHILSNYEKTKNNANQWFEEAVCEAASIQAVKDMSISWKTKPPYPNWKSYSSSLDEYFQELINEESRYLAKGDSLAKWYKREKKSLRNDAHQRDKNEVVGTKIFKYFNQSPKRWEAVKYLNIGDVQGKVSLQKYLKEWKIALPNDLKYVATTVSSWFGY